MPRSSRHLAAALLCAALAPVAAQAAWEFSGTKSIAATLADGTQVVLGSVVFSPSANGPASVKVSLRSEPFSDHFLSMREFKCLKGPQELTCHVPYPYTNPGTAGPGDLAWLEHRLMFFYKAPAEFGANLWNGVYFEFREVGSSLVGMPKAIDLNQIAAPPKDLARPPFGPALRHDMPATARWVRQLTIE